MNMHDELEAEYDKHSMRPRSHAAAWLELSGILVDKLQCDARTGGEELTVCTGPAM